MSWNDIWLNLVLVINTGGGLYLFVMYYSGWGWTPKDAPQTEGCDEPMDEIEDVAEPLDESVDEEANDARNYCAIFVT